MEVERLNKEQRAAVEHDGRHVSEIGNFQFSGNPVVDQVYTVETEKPFDIDIRHVLLIKLFFLHDRSFQHPVRAVSDYGKSSSNPPRYGGRNHRS